MSANRYTATDAELAENRMQIEWGMTPEGRFAWCVRQQQPDSDVGGAGVWKLLHYSELKDECMMFVAAHIGSDTTASQPESEFGVGGRNPGSPEPALDARTLSAPMGRHETGLSAPVGQRMLPPLGPAAVPQEQPNLDESTQSATSSTTDQVTVRDFNRPGDDTASFGASTNPGGQIDESGIRRGEQGALDAGMVSDTKTSQPTPEGQVAVADAEAHAEMTKQTDPGDVKTGAGDGAEAENVGETTAENRMLQDAAEEKDTEKAAKKKKPAEG